MKEPKSDPAVSYNDFKESEDSDTPA